MEAIGQQLAEFGGSAAVLTRAGSSFAGGLEAYDGGTRVGLTGRLRAVPGSPAPLKPELNEPEPFEPKPDESDADEAAPDESDADEAAPDEAARGEHEQALIATLAVASGARSVAPLGLAECGRLLAAAAAAPGLLAGADYVEAAEFAGHVEDLSRTVEYLQVLAAGTVDRTRTQAIAAADTARAGRARTGKGWVTGWDNGVETLTETDTAWPAAPTATGTPTDRLVTSPADDGCATTAEFLRQRLRIGKSEAHRRLALAADILPATTLTGQTLPAPRKHLTAALTPAATASPGTGSGAGPAVSSRAGTIISLTLNRLQHLTTGENLALIEENLTTTAAAADPDFLTRVARRWAETIDADGTEPSEEALRHTQGAFIRKPRHGLHHLDIYATTDQYEHLLAVMNTATNPRTTTGTNPGTGTAAELGPSTGTGTGTETAPGTGTGTGTDHWRDRGVDVELDRRTRPQKQLDGLVGAAKIALATNTLPSTGGNRPQIIATINYQDLLPHHKATHPTPTTGTHPGTDKNTTTATAPSTGTSTGTGTRTGTPPGTGNFVFTGPVAAATLRKIPCDADIIPALLGSHGEILDLGRKTRLFTPTQRLALTARDQGCTFPHCTIPAPWCEAHHITYWSHGGTTTINNGALLCSSHHHLIHKEQWTITTINGTPWYTPPKHLDPHQKPQQNHYFKPPPPPQATTETNTTARE